jgi:3-deoxy-7-phosphoheptulonate synthase
MAYKIVQELPTAEEVAERYPIQPEHRVEEHRQTNREILSGSDPRLLMVVGPCSAWPTEAVEQYAERLARLQEDVRERIFLNLRCYIQKPRTTLGWPGPLTQPDPLSPKADIRSGIWECRKMMWKVGKALPLADEMLFTNNEGYFAGMLSYIALGARSSADQEHRFIASGLFEHEDDCPVGVKNPTDGTIDVGVDGVECAQQPHEFAWRRNQVETAGNPYAHLVLRGGKQNINYDPASIARASQLLTDPKRNIRNPAIIVDASHDNCRNGHGKDPLLQEDVVHSIMTGKLRNRDSYQYVKGVMVESFLQRGSQKISPDMTRDGLSITDPCLGWDDTERLIRETADQMDQLLGRTVVSR